MATDTGTAGQNIFNRLENIITVGGDSNLSENLTKKVGLTPK